LNTKTDLELLFLVKELENAVQAAQEVEPGKEFSRMKDGIMRWEKIGRAPTGRSSVQNMHFYWTIIT
jgi:hypothetical protein